MAGKNYNKISKAKTAKADEPILVETIEEVMTEPAPEVKKEPAYGVVSCLSLNVRKGPDIREAILGLIHRNDKVLIDEAESTDGWYSVCTEAGLEGFCMKEYISIDK